MTRKVWIYVANIFLNGCPLLVNIVPLIYMRKITGFENVYHSYLYINMFTSAIVKVPHFDDTYTCI